MNFNIPMIRHTFFNAEEIVPNRSSATFETSFTKRSENNQTVFKTFNNTEFTENDEEYEYSNYLKEYESVIKNSRRK